MQLLGLIGITGEPADPTLSFPELGDTDPDLLSGTVQPMTLRNMIILLIKALPKAEIEALRSILEVAVHPDYAIEGDKDLAPEKEAQTSLAQLASVRLDSYPDSPLYYIHLDASQRRILEDVETYIRTMKKRRNILERRTHTLDFPNYSEVWDMRGGLEGWCYHLEAEQSFGIVADKLKRPKSTIANAYRSAFKRITGQDFSSEMWLRVMGPVKLAALTNNPAENLAARYRRLISSSGRSPYLRQATSKPAEHGMVGLVESQSAIKENRQASILNWIYLRFSKAAVVIRKLLKSWM